MRVLVCCVMFLSVACLGQQLSSSEELMATKFNMMKSYLREKKAMALLTDKVETICPGYGTKFETAMEKIQECTNAIEEDSETMCSAIKNHLEKCSKPIVNLFEECLPQKSRDIPAFVIKSMLATSDYLCKADGEHIFEIYNPCIRSMNYRTQRCLRKIQSKLQQYDETKPSKDEVCDFMGSFRGCLEAHLHHSCGHVKTREAFLNLFDAAKSACQSVPDLNLNEVETMEVNPKYYSNNQDKSIRFG
ncbi:hypothetical protein NQ315_013124 [Exocentrus adspersus]|uniref:Uncharacterized protein n=1 Tax=Exocentrus adspersus TaxID=1586481 RepID=A0AAV8VWH2_9CUCU|nr:hypothetical protein NQ315_013124 [Exocentrus adspersus]